MKYTIPSKPTVYADTHFRSRLEARWAAFFDLLGWQYVYEPFDMGCWAPDFLLLGDYKVLVEVKPILEFSSEVAEKIEAAMIPWLEAMDESCGWETLLLGICPLIQYEGYHYMGWCAEVNRPEPGMNSDKNNGLEFWWSGASAGIWSDNNPQKLFGYCHAYGFFKDRITGGYDGGSHGAGDFENHSNYLMSLWSQAGNITQWKWKGASR